jgi:Amt family ammonium transporter
MVLSGTVSWVLLKLIGRVATLRVGQDEEHEGLDLVLHNERGYIL